MSRAKLQMVLENGLRKAATRTTEKTVKFYVPSPPTSFSFFSPWRPGLHLLCLGEQPTVQNLLVPKTLEGTYWAVFAQSALTVKTCCVNLVASIVITWEVGHRGRNGRSPGKGEHCERGRQLHGCSRQVPYTVSFSHFFNFLVFSPRSLLLLPPTFLKVLIHSKLTDPLIEA